MENVILIDTHAVVWLYAGRTDLFTPKGLSLLREGKIMMSPASKLELEYLYEIGKINAKPDIIVSDLTEEIGLNVCEDSSSNIIDAAIKLTWTRDPFDRLIAAHTAIKNARLLTKDRIILSNFSLAVWE